ncbi:hypothetical protein ACIBAI_02790 [Streptomyces sp. NPDC051041]|uniref:hypothetical protein n=1 Tax=Streptomyces sp. NPDC051041 TaxID=3365640 RepID=UPI0037AB5E1E
MPRPTAAQLAHGLCTVILPALVVLLLSGAGPGPGIAVVAVVALVLGLLVALTVRLPKPGTAAAGKPAGEAGGPVRTAPAAPAGTEPVRERTAS